MPRSAQPSVAATPLMPKRGISIRWTLPICVIAPLLSGILLTNWLSFRSGQVAVEDLVNKISEEVAGNIEKRVSNYLIRPSMVSASLKADIESDNIDVSDVRGLGQTLWHFTQVDLFNNNIYYGNEQGEFVYSENQDEVQRLDFVDAATDFKRIAYETDDIGNPETELRQTDYDPRQRPWYQEAASRGTPIWSQVYVATSRSALTITRATPVFDAAGQLKGIFGVDVYLVELSDFLRNLEISPNGRAFIMEPSGELIAVSADEEPFIDHQDGSKLRLPAAESQDPLIRATAQRWLSDFASATGTDSSTDFAELAFEFEIDGETQLAYIYPLQEASVDWVIGVVIPKNDYMATINASARRTLIVGSLVTGAASLLALLAALYIVRPINRLNSAAKDIKLNRYAPDSLKDVMNRPDEFSELAELFNDMAIVVVSREQSLAEQVTLLKSEIAQQGHRSSRYELEALLQRARQARARVR